MTLFTKAHTEKLLANCQEQIINNDAGHSDIDFKPVVKLFTPDAQCTWLLTELGNDDIAYGLCDLGWELLRLALSACASCAKRAGPWAFPSSVICTSKRIKPSLLTPKMRARTGVSSPNGASDASKTRRPIPSTWARPSTLFPGIPGLSSSVRTLAAIRPGAQN